MAGLATHTGAAAEGWKTVTASVILSHFQTEDLVAVREAGGDSAEVSPDLGLTLVEVLIDAAGVCFPNGEMLDWDALQKVSESKNGCFLIEEGRARKIQLFSELTTRLYSLMPTRLAPTMLISGIPMHRIKGADPYHDTLEKVKTIKPIVGPVLDTATGLGYTAIEAAKTADQVVTIELDPAALEIARLNPWSRDLFENPRIVQRIGDSYDLIEAFDDEAFARVIHDPPTFSLAGHLYSSEFYAHVYRVLRRGGCLFHYIGDPDSRSGHNITRGVTRRLKEVGFTSIQSRPRAFGVVATR